MKRQAEGGGEPPQKKQHIPFGGPPPVKYNTGYGNRDEVGLCIGVVQGEDRVEEAVEGAVVCLVVDEAAGKQRMMTDDRVVSRLLEKFGWFSCAKGS